VLYVEDEQETANICKAVLVARNYDVDLAFTGKDGKDQFACGAYDAVLLDYRLPDMDGLELARAMLAEEPSIPIVFITGRGSEKIAAEALALGVSQYVVKDNEDVYTTVLPEVISSVIKRAEDKESLSKCEDRYDRAIAGSQIGLWEWNIKTDEEFYSTQWLQIVGYEDGEFGTDRGAFLRLVHPNDVSAVKESLRAHFENHEPYLGAVASRSVSGQKWRTGIHVRVFNRHHRAKIYRRGAYRK
jgi:CheY-like chemotaxis protein